MEHLDTWVRVAELLLVVAIVPSLRLLITTLVSLQQSVALLKQSLEQHRDAFIDHVKEDRDNFDGLTARLTTVDGNVQQVRGMLQASGRGRHGD